MALKNNSGFTAFELLTVMAVLGILAGIAVVSMGNPLGFQAVAEAEALKANLRFTQSKAMADLPRDPVSGTVIIWSLNITSNSYTILRNGVAPNPPVYLPGSYSGTYTLPNGLSVASGAGVVRFNFRGQPIDAGGAPLAANLSLTVDGTPPITITRETGFIP
jgi:prepilin-type N-terminal cleavage/methylation domain-containing protein